MESPTIWEISRICAVTVEGQPQRRKNGVSYVFSELITGMAEVALLAGLTQMVAVFDARLYRILRSAGCELEIIGRPQRIGAVMAFAGLFRIGPDLLEAHRDALGVEGSVLAPGARELAFA